MSQPTRFYKEMLLPTRDIDAAWALLSDSDRLNRHAGLGFQFSSEQDPSGRTLRIGRVRRFGLELDWVDEPFEYEAPLWFRSRRRFRRGPVQDLETRMTLRVEPEGVAMTYEVTLTPAGWWAAPIVQIELASSIRPTLERALHDAAAALRSPDARFSSPPQLSPAANDHLAALADLPTGAVWASAVRSWDRRAQDALRPLELARRSGAPPDVLILDGLEATRRGALSVSFDLLCPSCRGRTTRLDTLRLDGGPQHCASCSIAFDGTFPDEVEVTFRPTGAVRPEPPPLDCVHSPSHTPHVLARWRLGAGEERGVTLALAAGSYRLRASADGGSDGWIEVREGLAATGASIEVGEGAIAPARLGFSPGTVHLWFRNGSAAPVDLTCHRRERPADTLTVGRLLEVRGAAQFLGLDAPHVLRQAGIVVVEGRLGGSALDAAVRPLWRADRGADTFDLEAGGPVAAHRADGAWIVVFSSAAEAFTSARRLLPAPDLAVVVASGPTSLIFGTGWPTGEAVDRAVAAARRNAPGRMAVPLEEWLAGTWTEVVSRLGLTGTPHPEIGLFILPSPPAPPRAADWPEVVGGRYRLGAELARGGMGVVRAATDLQGGPPVVLKTLTADALAQPLHVQRFLWEARLTARVQHPNCVRVLAFGCEGELPWMALERLEGQDLADRLKGMPRLPVDQAVDIAIDVLEGLQAAHDGGVIHRDVKPGNIWLSDQPRPDHARILDFGIAVALDDADEPEDGRLLGSPKYMAPEQVARLPLDGRADVYAAGTVLYEMLSGVTPFTGLDARMIALRRIAEAPPPLRAVAPDLPAALAAIVDRALLRDPEGRWPNPKALAGALRAFRAAPPATVG